MSLLSIKIEELISESGETVQSLAEMGNLSRSTLQRVKSGERLPSKNFFRSMCKVLRLSATQEEELRVLLEMATVGERAYYNRGKIIEFIETISELTEYKIPFSKELSLKEGRHRIDTISETPEIFDGESEVFKIIQNSIDTELFFSETPQLKMAIPYDCLQIYQYIFQQMMGNHKSLVLQDVLNLSKEYDETIGDKGLSILKYLIALSLLDNVEYQSNYYYQSKDLNYERSALFPYFLLTSNRVITISRDFKNAVLYHNPEFLMLYQDGYRKIMENTESFIEESSDLFKIYSLDNCFEAKQVIEPLPCFAYYYTNELLEKKINKDFFYSRELLEAAKKYYESFRCENHPMINFFSLKNLRQFMLDGSLYFPEEVSIPFTPAERLMLVKQLREDLSTNKRKAYALNDEKIFLNSSIEFINEYTAIRLILHYKNDEKLVFKTIVLQEESIINAFDDFMDSLPGSEYVLAEETTLAELDKIICECENSGLKV